ncbi:PREDICTED: probable phospholipid-transporting ATPase VA, partial [Galeopterus variegatus]|uniref:Probable phospholipid-transporting ATPase VA n=1 Tax=Galeopterus variegatus TaxID=482537 RepID=A0ABM0RWN7_GALVR
MPLGPIGNSEFGLRKSRCEKIPDFRSSVTQQNLGTLERNVDGMSKACSEKGKETLHPGAGASESSEGGAEEPPRRKRPGRASVRARGRLWRQRWCAQHLADNRVKTTKYTVLSFLPKNLFEQFHRLANVYFVFIALLNFVPAVNAFQPGLALAPVLFILAVTAFKDLWEDYSRHRSDHEINHLGCLVFSGEEKNYVNRFWKEIHVGDFVHLRCNEIIPADILLLSSSDPDGLCHIETANLDGETNLKRRQVVRGFSELV